jgi:hypothetical protein
VQAHRRREKRCVTLFLSLTAAGHVLPRQVIFKGITKRVLPKRPDALKLQYQS